VADTSRMRPDFNVYLDGTKLDGEAKGAISGIRVYLTHSGASAFEIVVDDPELRWQGKPTFTECKEVQIELGVPGKMKKVFDGEVTAWRTELERAGPTVMVLRGMDRSHRLMRGHRTKTYANASPLDCAQQIASAAGLTAKTSAGQPAPVKTFRMQANESDFSFLRKMAELEGYLFYVDGSDLHFERPKVPSKDDVTVTFGEDLKTFLPVANFRRPAAKVEVGAWDSGGKAALTGKAKPGDELWSVPGGKHGADLAKFQGTKASLGIVESQVATQEHADTVAKAALTKRSLEFLTAEVEVQGNPDIKPGAMVNVKKVGVYSGHYLVTEANHFYDAAGYDCIFYVARDKWGDSSTTKEKQQQAKQQQNAANKGAAAKKKKAVVEMDGIHRRLVDAETGEPLRNVEYEIALHGGKKRRGKTDDEGFLEEKDVVKGNFTIRILGPQIEPFENVEAEPTSKHPEHVPLGSGEHEAPDGEPASPLAPAIDHVAAQPRRLFQGEKVRLSAHVLAADGTQAVFRVFVDDSLEAVAELQAEVKGLRATIEWECAATTPTGYERGVGFTDFDLEVECEGAAARCPDVPSFRAFEATTDGIHRRLVDPATGEPHAFTRYEIRLQDGEIRRGQTDADGFLEEDDVPSGTFEIELLGNDVPLFEPVEDAPSADVGEEPPPVHSAGAPPEDAVAPLLAHLSVGPNRVFEGERVRLSVQVAGAGKAKPIFRIYEVDGGVPLATIDANVAGTVASCDWTAAAAHPTGSEAGLQFADLDVEVECGGEVLRARALPALRVFREGST
jgi:uncharacterized protein